MLFLFQLSFQPADLGTHAFQIRVDAEGAAEALESENALVQQQVTMPMPLAAPK